MDESDDFRRRWLVTRVFGREDGEGDGEDRSGDEERRVAGGGGKGTVRGDELYMMYGSVSKDESDLIGKSMF